MSADITRRWIVANVIAVAVATGLELVGYAIRQTTDAAAISVAVGTVTTVLYYSLYAYLTSDVLMSIVPTFPRRAWLSLHVVLGFVAGLFFSFQGLQPDDGNPLVLGNIGLTVIVLCVFALGGGILGAAVGGLQALVMRPVAEGLGLWIVCSAVETGLLAMALLFTVTVLTDQTSLRGELVLNGLTLVMGVVGAFIMLPAVRGLRPRSGPAATHAGGG